MMHDTTVSAAALAETLGWLLGAALVVLELLTDWRTGDLGLLIAGASGVLQVKGYVAGQRRKFEQAYQLGLHTDVRQIR